MQAGIQHLLLMFRWITGSSGSDVCPTGLTGKVILEGKPEALSDILTTSWLFYVGAL